MSLFADVKKHRKFGFETLETRSMLAVGDLDVSFAYSGVLRDTFVQTRTSSEMATDIVARPGGGFYVAGNLNNGRGNTGVILSYQNNGTLQSSFGENGFARVPLASGNERLTAMDLQADGKIVAAGFARDSRPQATSTVVVSRLNANGTIDTSFGSNGLVYTPFTFHAGPNAVKTRQTGEILVVASEFDKLHLVQYLPSGLLDSKFAVDGIADYSIDNFNCFDALLLADGSSIVALVQSTSDGNVMAKLIKFLPNGVLDTQFGDWGVVAFPVASQLQGRSYDTPLRLEETINGNILLAGTQRVDSTHNYFVRMFSMLGIPDANFGVKGLINIPIQGTFGTMVNDIESKPTGSIVLTGAVVIEGSSQNRTINVYLNGNGSFNENFGIHGTVSLANPLSGGRTAIVGDRLIYAATSPGWFPPNDIVILGVSKSGELDSTFGVGGRIESNVDTSWGQSNAQTVIELSDGKLLAAMGNYTAGQSQLVLTRYNKNGSLDTSYGIAGKTPVGDFLHNFSGFSPRMMRTSTGIYLAFQQFNTVRLSKLTATGEIDFSFGALGWLTLESNDFQLVQDLVIAEDAMYLAGRGNYGYQNGILVQSNLIKKLDWTGTPDPSFGNDGITELPLVFQNSSSGINIETQGDHLLVLLDNHPDDQPFQVSLTRLNALGLVDASFGNAGRKLTQFESGNSIDKHRWLQVAADGSVLVYGSRPAINGRLGVFIRMEKYSQDGDVVSEFGTAGSVEIPVGSTDVVPNAMAIDSLGRILVSAGIIDNQTTTLMVARYMPNGTLDASFSQDGINTFPFGKFSEAFPNMIVTQNDNIIISGTETGPKDSHGILARIIGSRPPQEQWNNSIIAEDVDGDFIISPIDVLLVINHLNMLGSGKLPAIKSGSSFLDVDGDGFVTPLDALQIINKLNIFNGTGAEGEGEIGAEGEGTTNAVTSKPIITLYPGFETEIEYRRIQACDRFFVRLGDRSKG